jgi:3-hydroxymyristoyl/3-hydroxydecanoyl-(acyl carrier protein) dehydratase
MTGPLLPTVLSRSGASFTLAMDADLQAFQGHFPGHPILPGVLQVDWAIRFGAEAFGPLGRFRGIDQLKFQGLIQPGEVLELQLEFEPARGRLRFTYLAGPQRKSSGVILFAS